LRSGEVAEVLAELGSTHPYVVANVGPRVDDLPETGGPARFGVTRAVLSRADVVILVGSTTPVGVTRVVDWLADGRSLVAGKPLHILLNQHPGGSFVHSEAEVELRRSVRQAGAPRFVGWSVGGARPILQGDRETRRSRALVRGGCRVTTASLPNAYETIRQRSLERIDVEKLDPNHDAARIGGVVSNAVDEYQALAHQGAAGLRALRDPTEMVRRVLRSITRFGALTELFERPEIEEIFIEGDRVTYIDGDGRLQSMTTQTRSRRRFVATPCAARTSGSWCRRGP
jgi:hypothetical protein